MKIKNKPRNFIAKDLFTNGLYKHKIQNKKKFKRSIKHKQQGEN